MNKKEYIDLISEKLGYTKKECEEIVNELFLQFEQTLKNKDKIVISNFGTLEAYRLPEHEIFSPYDGKTLKVSDVRLKFKASSNLKEYIRNN